MRKLGIGIGWTVFCVWSTVAAYSLAEEAPPSAAQAGEAQPSAAPTAQPESAPATPAPMSGAATPAPTSGAATPAPTSGAATPAPTSGAATPAPTSGAATPSAEVGAQTDTDARAPSKGGALSADKKMETVPEAVAVEPSSLPPTRVGIEPSEAKKKPEGDRNILVGSWTKNILFATEDNSFRFQPTGGVQTRLALAVNTDEDTNKDEPMNGTGFTFLRARVGFQAWFFKFGKVKLETEWKTGKGELLEGFADFGPNNGDGAVAVRIGRFKPYLSRQFMQNSFQLQMIENARSWANLDLVSTPSETEMNSFKYSTAAIMQREIGIGVQGFVANGLEYGVGIWNGEDGYATDADFMFGGRLAVHPMGLAGGRALRIGDESDTEVASSPALSIGAAAMIEDRNDATIDLPGECPSEDLLSMCPYEDAKLRAGFEVAFKYAGVSLAGEFFLIKTWAKDEVIQKFALNKFYRDAPGLGGYLQAGYMIVPKRFELVGRFDALDENTAIRGMQFFPTVGASYYILGHNLKVQFQYRINVGTGYVKGEDALYMPITHDILFMLQASI